MKKQKVVGIIATPSPENEDINAVQRKRSVLDRALATVRSEIFAEERIKLLVEEKRVEREKHIILGLLWLVAAISSLDRVAMSVALVSMSSEFDFSETIKGSISSLFSVGYGLAILPAGLMLSCLSPRQVTAFGVALWSMATIATPASADLLALQLMAPILFVRACVGVGEAMVVPTIQKLLAVWTTTEQKSFGAYEYNILHFFCYFASPRAFCERRKHPS